MKILWISFRLHGRPPSSGHSISEWWHLNGIMNHWISKVLPLVLNGWAKYPVAQGFRGALFSEKITHVCQLFGVIFSLLSVQLVQSTSTYGPCFGGGAFPFWGRHFRKKNKQVFCQHSRRFRMEKRVKPQWLLDAFLVSLWTSRIYPIVFRSALFFSPPRGVNFPSEGHAATASGRHVLINQFWASYEVIWRRLRPSYRSQPRAFFPGVPNPFTDTSGQPQTRPSE